MGRKIVRLVNVNPKHRRFGKTCELPESEYLKSPKVREDGWVIQSEVEETHEVKSLGIGNSEKKNEPGNQSFADEVVLESKILRLYGDGLTYKKIAEQAGVNVSKVQRVISKDKKREKDK